MSDNDDGDCCYPIRDTKPAMTDHAQREIIEVGDPMFAANVLWEKAVGVCIGEACGRQFISRERFDSVIVPALAQAHAQGRREAFAEIAIAKTSTKERT